MSSVSFSKQIEIYGEYDVAVIGGGPAGVSAAISSAREGAKTILIEGSGMLGGMATSGLVGPFMTNYDRDCKEKTVAGIYEEIVKRLVKESAAVCPEEVSAPSLYTSFIERYHSRLTPFDTFALQKVLDQMVREAGAEVLCYTHFSDCILENGEIKSVILSAPEGLIAVNAKVFIDCTGIAAVADKAGVPNYIGDEETNTPQPGTLMFEVSGVDDEKYLEYGARPEYPVKAYKLPTQGHYKVNHYHVFSVNAANAKSLTEAHAEARGQVFDAYRVLHDKTPGFENAKIAAVASVLGVRENRHIEAEYQITVDDVTQGTRFEDRIAVYGYGLDVHRRSLKESGNFKIEIAERYYIPYRSLLPKGCENLLVAGKTIGCKSQAAGGLRCMPSAMAMGQAAGIAAAISANKCQGIKKIDVKEIQRRLKENGAIID